MAKIITAEKENEATSTSATIAKQSCRHFDLAFTAQIARIARASSPPARTKIPTKVPRATVSLSD